MFENISIMGRVAYGFYALEEYLKELGVYYTSSWDILFERFWSFSQFDHVDEYTYLLAECLPDSILEFEDFFQSGDWEYITETEFTSFRSLYKGCSMLSDISNILNNIHEMLSIHLYTENKFPAQESLEIMNNELYPFFKSGLKQMPDTAPFLIYSIKDVKCWGVFHSKKVLEERIRMFSEGKVLEEQDLLKSDLIIVEPESLLIQKIVKGSPKFQGFFQEPKGYDIVTAPWEIVEGKSEGIFRFYMMKLQQAVSHADVLIQKAFRADFYDFYGVRHDIVESPEEMCSQLIFDSFVMVTQTRTIEACLSNETFMFGHYIECCWDYDWNLIYLRIC